MEDRETKTVGGSVDAEVYWKFKAAAADRKESMQQALTHALMLYIDCINNNPQGGNDIEN